MIKQLLIDRTDFWLNEKRRTKNTFTKHTIDLVLNELLLFAEEYYNSHLIGIETYLMIENKIKEGK